MSNSKYNYDEDSLTWPYFAFTLVAVLTVPPTLSTVSSLFSGASVSDNSPITTSFKPSNSGSIEKFRRKSKASSLISWKTFFVVVGWALLYYLASTLASKEAAVSATLFDPFEILQISSSATEREIKSAFRKLSVKMHPDKISSSLSDAEKVAAEQAYVLVSKAYKALTDPVTKENFLKYGHPDGPQAITQGIALPKFLIESQGLVILYVAVIAVVLPLVVRYWWNHAKQYTKKGIHAETATLFVESLLNYRPTDLITPTMVIQWVSNAEEFKLNKLNSEQVFALIEAYCNRKIAKKDEQKAFFVVSKLPVLLSGLLDIAAAFRNTEVAEATIAALQLVSQAVPFKGHVHHQLLQLPHAQQSAVTKSDVRTLGKFLTLSADLQKKTLGIKSDKELEEAVAVALKIPLLRLLSAKFVVPGEDVVPPGLIAHIVLKVLVKSAAHKQKVSEKDFTKAQLNDEEETFELLQDPFKKVREQPLLPEAYAPFFPGELQTQWLATLALQKDGKLIEQPTVVLNLDLSNLKLLPAEFKEAVAKKEGLAVGTIKIPVTQPAPNDPGNYEFRLVVTSNVYFGSSLDIPLVMKVENPPPEDNSKAHDIPPAQEDSLEGAMALLRGEPVAANGGDVYFDSEDEDEIVEGVGLELDDDDWSDIDTDTDDEIEEEKKTK